MNKFALISRDRDIRLPCIYAPLSQREARLREFGWTMLRNRQRIPHEMFRDNMLTTVPDYILEQSAKIAADEPRPKMSAIYKVDEPAVEAIILMLGMTSSGKSLGNEELMAVMSFIEERCPLVECHRE